MIAVSFPGSWLATDRLAAKAAMWLLFLLLIPALSSAEPAVETARLYASWHAPYGDPRASDTLFTSCDDTSHTDTLYLAFEFQRPVPDITVIQASIYFRPQVGDTLREFWFFKSGSANEKSLYIDFAPYQGGGCRSPWNDPGIYEVQYDRRSGGGRLELTYYIPFENTLAVDTDVRYCLARVRILHRRSQLPGCGQPVLIEWGSAHIGFATGREISVNAGEQRALRWNAGREIDFGIPRATSLAKPWVPKPR